MSLYFLSIGRMRVKADLHRARVSHAGLRASETLDPIVAANGNRCFGRKIIALATNELRLCDGGRREEKLCDKTIEPGECVGGLKGGATRWRGGLGGPGPSDTTGTHTHVHTTDTLNLFGLYKYINI